MEPTDRFAGWEHGCGGMAVLFCDWLKTRTNGRLEIDLAPPMGIVSVMDQMQATGEGTLDFGLQWPGLYTGVVPEADVEIGLPFSWLNAEEHWDFMRYWGGQELFEEIYAEWNVYPIEWGMSDMRSFGTAFPIDTPDDLNGKKIRVGGIYAKIVEAFGGSAAIFPWAEAYMAMKLGTVDGFMYGPLGLEDVKMKEVTDYYVVYPIADQVSGALQFNLDSLNALPEDIQLIIKEEGPAILAGWVYTYYSYERWVVNKCEDDGYIEQVSWSEEDANRVREVAYGLWDEIAAKSPRCKQLVDMVKAQMKEYRRM